MTNRTVHAYWLGANIQFAAHALTWKEPPTAIKELTDAIGHAEALGLSQALLYSLEGIRQSIQQNVYSTVTCVNHLLRMGQVAAEELRRL
jgi:hypothetical protein